MTETDEKAKQASGPEAETGTAEAVKGKKAAPKSRKNKKAKKQIATGNVYIQATYNNTIVTLTDPEGNVLSWASAGMVGFHGPKKATPYAASVIVRTAAEKAVDYGLKDVYVFVKGVGQGRESAIRALNANNLNILSIKDVTPIPHNGCRATSPRRV